MRPLCVTFFLENNFNVLIGYNVHSQAFTVCDEELPFSINQITAYMILWKNRFKVLFLNKKTK